MPRVLRLISCVSAVSLSGVALLTPDRAVAGGHPHKRQTYLVAPGYYPVQPVAAAYAPAAYAPAAYAPAAYAPAAYAPMAGISSYPYASAPYGYAAAPVAASVAAAPVAASPVAGVASAPEDVDSDYVLDGPSREVFLDDLRRLYANGSEGDTGLARITSLQGKAEEEFKTFRDAKLTDPSGELSQAEKSRVNDLVQQVVREARERELRERARSAYQQSPRPSLGYAPAAVSPVYFAQPFYYQMAPPPPSHKHHFSHK